jgi:rhodanese-related sulfurtransferase
VVGIDTEGIDRQRGYMKLMKTLQWKLTVRQAAWLLILSLALACAAYFLRPAAMPVGSMNEGGAADEMLAKAIAFEAAVDHFKNGTAIFADARPHKAFEGGHIKGALHLDPTEFDQWSDQMFSYAFEEAVFITYCEGPQCTLSLELAEKLAWLGFENVYCLKDGWGLWKEHKLPMGEGGE